MKLSEMKNGQCGVIHKIQVDEEDRKRLFYLGIYPCAIIQKLKCAPLKDPILFMVKGTQLVLRREVCVKIDVEVIR